ncbi:hypothetical protein TNIN_331761 [Trichonephila inaurata madagascariensis]|uniref:Uncharacterized protein n=1 Tax=Trichonephila inaurata madagascariensis TaxID=2747483 RepID=A0A8X6XL66_9ARAC|nr:hypothetical protein TNIN_331761 [Trichonephila inaurata madagascariensis]
MDFRCIHVVFAVVLCATSAYAIYPLMPSEELLSIARCVGTSKNQTLCDDFMKCHSYLAKPYSDAFADCKKVHSPDGIGQCTEDKELYFSEEIRVKLDDCVRQTVTQDLNEEETAEMDKFQECFRSFAKKCPGGQDQ